MSAKTVNAKGSAEKMQKFFEILEKYEPLNYGDMKTGNHFNSERATLYDKIKNNSIVHFVFNDPIGQRFWQSLKGGWGLPSWSVVWWIKRTNSANTLD
jgi:hypothetical protein